MRSRLATKRVRGQVSGCPRNCQRRAAGPSAPLRPRYGQRARRVTVAAQRHGKTGPAAVTREPGDLPSSRYHNAAGRGAPAAGERTMTAIRPTPTPPRPRTQLSTNAAREASMTVIEQSGLPPHRPPARAEDARWNDSGPATIDEAALLAEAARLRASHWRLQVGLGISHVPSGDVLAIRPCAGHRVHAGRDPARLRLARWRRSRCRRYFALARGSRAHAPRNARPASRPACRRWR